MTQNLINKLNFCLKNGFWMLKSRNLGSITNNFGTGSSEKNACTTNARLSSQCARVLPMRACTTNARVYYILSYEQD